LRAVIEFLTPGRFADTLLKAERIWPRLLRGIAILAAATLALIYSSYYVLHDKIDVKYALSGFENLPAPIPSFEEITASRIIHISVALAVIFIGLRVLVYFTGKEGRNQALLTLILHSFLILLALTLIGLPIIAQAPKVPFLVVDVTFMNATMHDASITGLSEQGRVSLASNTINARYLKIYKGFQNNYTRPNWRVMQSFEEVDKVLKNTVTVINMSEVKWVSEDGEHTLPMLNAVKGNWSEITYEDVLSRGFVRYDAGEVTLAERVFSMLPIFTWALVTFYNVVGFKKLYEASAKVAAIAWILIFFILFVAGITQ